MSICHVSTAMELALPPVKKLILIYIANEYRDDCPPAEIRLSAIADFLDMKPFQSIFFPSDIESIKAHLADLASMSLISVSPPTPDDEDVLFVEVLV
jgi:hypothetical protein